MYLQNQAMALTRGCRTPPSASTPAATGGSNRDSAERASTPAPPRSAASFESVVSPPSVKDDFDHSKSTTGKLLFVIFYVVFLFHKNFKSSFHRELRIVVALSLIHI